MLGNVARADYDPNSNVVRVDEIEVPGPKATGDPETYVTLYDYDELNRSTAIHERGLNAQVDHVTSLAYDSRNNLRLAGDAEHLFVLISYDDADRAITAICARSSVMRAARRRFSSSPSDW